MQIYKDWLTSQNVKFTETPVGLIFSYQGCVFIIEDNTNDKLFLRIRMPRIYTVSSDEKEKVLELVNKMNYETKCLKASIDEDDEVNLFTEIFVDSTPEVDDFLGRLLQIMIESRIEFRVRMR